MGRSDLRRAALLALAAILLVAGICTTGLLSVLLALAAASLAWGSVRM